MRSGGCGCEMRGARGVERQPLALSARPRLHRCSPAPHRGACQRRSQRSPRRASRTAAEAPPPETARVQPCTTPWCAPAWKPAQTATSEQSVGRGAAARGCTGAASHHTVVRAS
eukprot:scaffold55799_cov27-Phaeocystis_antarctica.AAC.1